ncbi:Hypothetical predicted protein [Olea europaea subsp. europaea]|uniref:Uncharacterized protein n=1 Tax=Olea europaea subsp. europaea TaxID=158383 RepID=A0A8S0PHN7_OLEEU|nr:Hypothetical predicted protein [Olea europaea subsp. europaea]
MNSADNEKPVLSSDHKDGAAIWCIGLVKVQNQGTTMLGVPTFPLLKCLGVPFWFKEEDNPPEHEDRLIGDEVVEEDRLEDNPEEESSQAELEHDSEAEQIEKWWSIS